MNNKPNAVDQYLGQRLQLRRTILGFSQKDLANMCGVTFQQIQKYESAENRISASRLFEIGHILSTPISFFFDGLSDNTDELHIDDPLKKNESLQLIKLFWKLPTHQQILILQLLQSLNGDDIK